MLLLPSALWLPRIEALVGAISELAQRSRFWLPLPLHSQMPVEQQAGGVDNRDRPSRKPTQVVNLARNS